MTITYDNPILGVWFHVFAAIAIVLLVVVLMYIIIQEAIFIWRETVWMEKENAWDEEGPVKSGPSFFFYNQEEDPENEDHKPSEENREAAL